MVLAKVLFFYSPRCTGSTSVFSAYIFFFDKSVSTSSLACHDPRRILPFGGPGVRDDVSLRAKDRFVAYSLHVFPGIESVLSRFMRHTFTYIL